MPSTFLKAFGLTAFSLFISINAKADVVKNCDVLRNAQDTVSARDIAKCQDLSIQKQPIFLGAGSGRDIGGCFTADLMSASVALNSCRTFAVENGFEPRDCKKITTFKVSDGYTCQFNALYYLKNDNAAFIGFTLDKETQTKLFEEAQSRSISVRQLINEKLRR